MKLAALAAPALFVLISMCGTAVPDPGGTVNGVAFYDANRNGLHDSCDAVLPQAIVSATGQDGTTTAQATSADDGSFRIEHAPAGDDVISLTASPGFAWPVTTTSGNATGIVAHVEKLKETSGLEIGSASRSAFDTSQLTVIGIAFNDANGNGGIDLNECGIEATSVGNIQYDQGQIAGLRSDGTYEIRDVNRVHDVPFSLRPLNQLRGRGGQVGWKTTTGAVSEDLCAFSVTPKPRYGTNIYEANVGLTRETSIGSITGAVYVDENENGVRDQGETAVSNTSLTLLPADGSCAIYYEPLVSFTDADGKFARYSVPAGTYTLALQGGYYDPTKDVYPDTLLAPAKDYRTVTVTGDTTRDFAMRRVQGANVLFHAFDDTNQDGHRSDGEPAVSGIELCLGIQQYDSGSAGPPGFAGPGYVSCGTSDVSGEGKTGPLFAGTYPRNVQSYRLPISDSRVDNRNISLSEGQQLDYEVPVHVTTAAEQVLIPGGSGAEEPINVCYADPAWVQPPFDESNVFLSGDSFNQAPPAETNEEVYGDGIYQMGSQRYRIWSSAAGLGPYPSDVPRPTSRTSLEACQRILGPMIAFVNYEPISASSNLTDVTQIVLRRHDSGLWSAGVPNANRPGSNGAQYGWYLFVDEGFEPIARCTAHGDYCEWYD